MDKSLRLYLLFYLWLSGLLAFAQPRINPPTLTYRAGNTNALDLIVTRAGVTLTPSSSLSITAEIRASDVGRIMYAFPLSNADTLAGTIRGTLPNLAPGLYYLGLYVKYAGEPDFRVGVARINIVPTGSLSAVTDASGLNIQISEVAQVLSVQLDATPSSAIAAFYADKSKAYADSSAAKATVAALAVLAGKVDKVAGKGLSTNDLTNAYKNRLDSTYIKLAGKVDKQTGKGLSANDFTNAYKARTDSLYLYLGSKQATLVSGTNIKTVNGQPIIGSGNLTIQAGVTSVNSQTGAVTLSVTTSFTTSIPFTALYTNLGQQVISSPLTFTPNSVSAGVGNGAGVRLIADGVNAPNFSAFKESSGSSGYVNNPGIINLCLFFFDGTDYYVSITQQSGQTALDYYPPVLQSASVADNARSSVVLLYNESLSSTNVPAPSSYTVSGGKSVTALAISGSSVTLTTSAAYAQGDVITVGYTQPVTSKVQDLSANVAASFSGISVTNSLTVPTLVSASIAQSSPSSITLTYNKTLSSGFVPATSSYSVSPANSVTSLVVSGSTVVASLASAYSYSDVITSSYTQPGSNALRDNYGSLAASFSSYTVTNGIGSITWTNLVNATASGNNLTSTGGAGSAYALSNLHVIGSGTGGAQFDYTTAGTGGGVGIALDVNNTTPGSTNDKYFNYPLTVYIYSNTLYRSILNQAATGGVTSLGSVTAPLTVRTLRLSGNILIQVSSDGVTWTTRETLPISSTTGITTLTGDLYIKGQIYDSGNTLRNAKAINGQ